MVVLGLLVGLVDCFFGWLIWPWLFGWCWLVGWLVGVISWLVGWSVRLLMAACSCLFVCLLALVGSCLLALFVGFAGWFVG